MSRLAQAGLTAAPHRRAARAANASAHRGFERRAALERRRRPARERGSIAARVAADQHHGARVARHAARPAARSPGPCRRRRGSRRAWPARVGAQAVQRRDGRADVGALAVVEDSTPSTCATCSTRCGSPRYSRRPCSIGASGQPIGAGQRQRGQRVDRVVAAADAQRVGRHQALDDELFARRARLRLRVSSASSARTSQAMPFSIARGRSRRARAARRRRSVTYAALHDLATRPFAPAPASAPAACRIDRRRRRG